MNLAAKIYLACLGIAVLVFAMFPAENTYTTTVYPTEVRETVRETNTTTTIEQSEQLTVIENETERLEREVQETKTLAAAASNALQMETQARLASDATAQGAISLAATVSNDLATLGQEVAALKGQLAEYKQALNDANGSVVGLGARITALDGRIGDLGKDIKALRAYTDEQNKILLGYINDVETRLGRRITWIGISEICLSLAALGFIVVAIYLRRRR
jgi:chromosome segregation ATPase